MQARQRTGQAFPSSPLHHASQPHVLTSDAQNGTGRSSQQQAENTTPDASGQPCSVPEMHSTPYQSDRPHEPATSSPIFTARYQERQPDAELKDWMIDDDFLAKHADMSDLLTSVDDFFSTRWWESLDAIVALDTADSFPGEEFVKEYKLKDEYVMALKGVAHGWRWTRASAR